MIETYTEEDKREIHRISRMKASRRRLRVEPDSNEYRELWDSWIESQDLVIVFES